MGKNVQLSIENSIINISKTLHNKNISYVENYLTKRDIDYQNNIGYPIQIYLQLQHDGTIPNMLEKGPDFGKLECKAASAAIKEDETFQLSGDLQISGYDGESFSTSNAIKKLNLILFIIDKDTKDITDIRRLDFNKHRKQLEKDYKLIQSHLRKNLSGNPKGEILTAKKRGSVYGLFVRAGKIMKVTDSITNMNTTNTNNVTNNVTTNNVTTVTTKKQLTSIDQVSDSGTEFAASLMSKLIDKCDTDEKMNGLIYKLIEINNSIDTTC